MDAIALAKAFCEENYELFQEWLEERDLESTEAERILDMLESDASHA